MGMPYLQSRQPQRPFVKALRAVAPILIFFLVMAALANKKVGSKSNMKEIVVLYLVGTFLAAGVHLMGYIPRSILKQASLGQQIVVLNLHLLLPQAPPTH